LRAPSLRAGSALTLLVLRVLADDADDAGAPDHLAFRADLLDGRTDFHGMPLLGLWLLITINYAAPRQVVRGELDEHLVPGQDPDEVLAHLAGDVRQHLVLVLELHLEHRVRQRLDDGGCDLDRVFLRHAPSSISSETRGARRELGPGGRVFVV